MSFRMEGVAFSVCPPSSGLGHGNASARFSSPPPFASCGAKSKIRNCPPMQMLSRFLRALSPLPRRLLTHRPTPARSSLSMNSPAALFLTSRKPPPSATHVHPRLSATKRILTTMSLTTIRKFRARAEFPVGGELVSRLSQNAGEPLRRTALLQLLQR